MKNCFGLSTCFYKECTQENWRQAAEAGFTDAELIFSRVMPIEQIVTRADHLHDILTGCGLKVSSVHLPFNDKWDISDLDRERRHKNVEQLKLLLNWTGEKQIGIGVIHASFEPIPDAERPERLLRAAEAIDLLSGHGAGEGVRLAVENLPRSCLGNCADELLLLTDRGTRAGICLDVNHLLKESHREFIEKAGPYLMTTHLSDYDRIDERHWFVGDGCIDWQELRGMLEGAGYEGRYVFELAQNASCVPGFTFTPSDLLRRFRELFGSVESC